MIERELIEEIRRANDIAGVVSGYVRLTRKGATLVGLCPFHNEKTPSFHVAEDRQSFHCFGCGVGGNVITFVMMIENYEFLDAVKLLAERANITLEQRGNAEKARLLTEKRNKIYEMNKLAARFFYDCLNEPRGAHAAEYMDERGLSKNIRVKCGLGYSPKSGETLYSYLSQKGFDDKIIVESGLCVKSDKREDSYYDRFFDRLMFPIFDVSGKIAGFGGRSLGDAMPKYLNSPETPVFEKKRLLYGLNFARAAKKREIIIVEGYMDAIALYQVGFMNAVASLGTAFTQNHARLIKSYADSAVILYDSDEAGIKAVYKAIPFLIEQGLVVKVAQTVEAKDPDEYIRKFGAGKLKTLIQSAKSHIAFRIDNEKNKFNINESVEQKVAFTKEASKILKEVESEIERDAYIKETAKITGISENAIRSEIDVMPDDSPFIRRAVYSAARDTSQAKVSKSVLKAQRRFLSITAANKTAFYKSRNYVNADDFDGDVYKKLYAVIEELHAAGKAILAEEVTSYFYTAAEQTDVNRILCEVDATLPVKELEKEFSDLLKIIKRSSIDRKIALLIEKNDAKGVNTAKNEYKATQTLYISLTDG